MFQKEKKEDERNKAEFKRFIEIITHDDKTDVEDNHADCYTRNESHLMKEEFIQTSAVSKEQRIPVAAPPDVGIPVAAPKDVGIPVAAP